MCVRSVVLGGCWCVVTPVHWSTIWTAPFLLWRRCPGGNGSVSSVPGSPPKAKSSCPNVRRHSCKPVKVKEITFQFHSSQGKAWSWYVVLVAKASKKKNQLKSTPNSSRASSRRGSPRDSPVTVRSGKKRDFEEMEEDFSTKSKGRGRSKAKSDVNGGKQILTQKKIVAGRKERDYRIYSPISMSSL